MSDDFIELDDYLATNDDLVKQRVAIKDKIAELHRLGWPADRIAGHLRANFSSTAEYNDQQMLSRVEAEMRQLELHRRPPSEWQKIKMYLSQIWRKTQ